MARKVIQIATSRAHLYALCDDGMIYQLIDGGWESVVAVPRDGPQVPGFVINLAKPGTTSKGPRKPRR
jgi:hypothetical protein